MTRALITLVAVAAVVVYVVWGVNRLDRMTEECKAAGGHPVSAQRGWDVLCLRQDAIVRTKP